MKVGDLVCFRELGPQSRDRMINSFGKGLVTDVHVDENTVEVVWPKKDWTFRTISVGYLKRVRMVS